MPGVINGLKQRPRILYINQVYYCSILSFGNAGA